MAYEGGFRIPDGTFGVTGADYSEGPITLGPNGASMFVTGHANHQSIAEFSIPPLVNTMDRQEMNFGEHLQGFATVLDRAATGNPENQDRISGMELVDGQLFVTTWNYYDAGLASHHNLLVVDDAADIENSVVGGYHRLSPRAHAAGWITPVPEDYQDVLGGPYIVGGSSGKPIIGRLAVGVAMFTWDPSAEDYSNLEESTLINVTTLSDFSLDRPMGMPEGGDENAYLQNSDLTNDMWTHLSGATFGFIVPGTRTYAAFGSSGGHESGVGYKITDSDGVECAGYCPYDANDIGSFFWLFDLQDLVDAKEGVIAHDDVVPYEYGPFDVPHPQAEGMTNYFSGGTFDYDNEILYLTEDRGDPTGCCGRRPLILAFSFNAPGTGETEEPSETPGATDTQTDVPSDTEPPTVTQTDVPSETDTP